VRTKISMVIDIPDEAIIGTVQLIVFRVDDEGKFIHSLYSQDGVAILPTLEEAGSPIQLCVTALRETSDRCIAEALKGLEAERTANAHASNQQEVLRVGCGSGLPQPARLGPVPLLRGDGTGPRHLAEPCVSK